MSPVIIDEDDIDSLRHYGIQRKSGRYPWGSGETPEERSRSFLGLVRELEKQGLTQTQIADSFSTPDEKFTTTQLRATKTIARNQKRAADIAMANRLKYDKGMSNGAIAERMGLAGESSVRALLDPGAALRTDQLQDTANMLRSQIEKHGYIDVGAGVERYADVNRTQFDTAISMLKSEGYVNTKVQIDQLGTGANKTTTKILGPKGKTEKEAYLEIVTDNSKIKTLDVMKGDGKDFGPIPPPKSIDSSRVAIAYSKKNAKGEEIGGALADGVIYVRPGVDDVSLGGSRYAQVRVLVDGTHYLKGMAVYKDDLPDGVDLLFNTNKTDTGNKLDAMKSIKKDPEDPFGSALKDPILGPDGKRKTVMNIVNEEGDWSNWSRNLATQMLSKQKPSLAREQLDKTFKKKQEEFDEIRRLTNPAVKKKLLESYADDVDSSSVHLKAAAMDRQSTQVIMPLSKIKETEVYAPQFKNGERVVLVRYPHGGTFEIPELVVNNNHPEGKKLLGSNAKDAVGISAKVAERLSGADFDGDTVLVIPNNANKVKSKPALEGLKDFDPKRDYAAFEGMCKMSPKQKQTEMGKVSNLITDMTIKGANDNEIARAVRHSMVVIDAEKHNLNYKQSYADNNIAQLKAKYQKKEDLDAKGVGASTLISRTSREARVLDRKRNYKIDPETGKKIYTYTGAGYTNAKGVWIPKITKSKEGAETDDAHTLSSGTPIEKIYADHSNKLKALANDARKEYVNTQSIPYSQSANRVYAAQVKNLDTNLNVALKNAPLERQAQILANTKVKQRLDAEPDMESDEIRKLKGKELTKARVAIGSGKTLVPISDDEWEAIQAGAISNHKLTEILKNADLDRVKELATPREGSVMTSAKMARAEQLIASGRTPAEVATILGVAPSTLRTSMTRKEE